VEPLSGTMESAYNSPAPSVHLHTGPAATPAPAPSTRPRSPVWSYLIVAVVAAAIAGTISFWIFRPHSNSQPRAQAPQSGDQGPEQKPTPAAANPSSSPDEHPVLKSEPNPIVGRNQAPGSKDAANTQLADAKKSSGSTAGREVPAEVHRSPGPPQAQKQTAEAGITSSDKALPTARQSGAQTASNQSTQNSNAVQAAPQNTAPTHAESNNTEPKQPKQEVAVATPPETSTSIPPMHATPLMGVFIETSTGIDTQELAKQLINGCLSQPPFKLVSKRDPAGAVLTCIHCDDGKSFFILELMRGDRFLWSYRVQKVGTADAGNAPPETSAEVCKHLLQNTKNPK